jgi:hypothetical protein
VFPFGYYGDISSPLYPLVSAVVTWMFWVRQGKYYKIVTFGFKYPYAHPVLRFLN